MDEVAGKWTLPWTRKTYQLIEWAFSLGVIGATIWVGQSEVGHKAHPYFVFGTLSTAVLVAKAAGQKLEWDEKAARQAEEDAYRERRDEQARRMIEGILGYFWIRYFEKVNPSDRLDHRATLFRCVEYDGPIGKAKRLEIFAREVSHKSSTTTWEVDENNRDQCFGVAGRIWIDQEFGVFTAACDWSDDPNDQERYAKSLWMTVEQAARLGVRSKVFAGIPIMVNRSAWGVLLLDSRVGGQIDDNKKKVDLVRHYAAILARALEGMKP